MCAKRLCAEFENEIRIYPLYEKEAPIIDADTGDELYLCDIQCRFHSYINYSDREKRKLKEATRKKGCKGNCRRKIPKNEVEKIIKFIQDLRKER